MTMFTSGATNPQNRSISKDQAILVFNSISAATSLTNIVVVDDDHNVGNILLGTDSTFNGTSATFTLQGSNDNVTYTTVFQDDNTTPMSFTPATSSTYCFLLKRILFKYYKVIYTKGDASAGVIVATYFGKI